MGQGGKGRGAGNGTGCRVVCCGPEEALADQRWRLGQLWGPGGRQPSAPRLPLEKPDRRPLCTV